MDWSQPHVAPPEYARSEARRTNYRRVLPSVGLGILIALWWVVVEFCAHMRWESPGRGLGMVLGFALPLCAFGMHRPRRRSYVGSASWGTDSAIVTGVAGALALAWLMAFFLMETPDNRGGWSMLHGLGSLVVAACMLLGGYWVCTTPLEGRTSALPRRNDRRHAWGHDITRVMKLFAVATGLVAFGVALPSAQERASPSDPLLLVHVIPGTLLVLPWIAVAARSATAEAQSVYAARMTLCGVVGLSILDALDNLLVYSETYGGWTQPYAACALLFSLGVLAVAPYSAGRRWVAGAGVLVVCCWAVVVPWIPWSPQKLMAIRLRGIQEASLADALERLAPYEVWIHDSAAGPRHPGNGPRHVARLGDVDPHTLPRSGMLDLGGYFNGGGVHFTDGRVDGVNFCFD